MSTCLDAYTLHAYMLMHLPICVRSEEHTSELQSQSNLVCRLLLEKKKKQTYILNAHPVVCETHRSHGRAHQLPMANARARHLEVVKSLPAFHFDRTGHHLNKSSCP